MTGVVVGVESAVRTRKPRAEYDSPDKIALQHTEEDLSSHWQNPAISPQHDILDGVAHR